MTNQQIIDFIDYYINTHGYSPTVREIANAAGFKSTSTIYYRLERLRGEGKITWQYGANRTIRTV